MLEGIEQICLMTVRNLVKTYDLPIFPEKDAMEQFSLDYRDALESSDTGKSMQEDEINANTQNALKQYIMDFRNWLSCKDYTEDTG